MSIAAGTRFGSYEVVTQIGAGGMGEVEPICGRLSPQAKSRAQSGSSPRAAVARGEAERGISC
jgi:hypothetical protein